MEENGGEVPTATGKKRNRDTDEEETEDGKLSPVFSSDVKSRKAKNRRRSRPTQHPS